MSRMMAQVLAAQQSAPEKSQHEEVKLNNDSIRFLNEHASARDNIERRRRSGPAAYTAGRSHG